MKRALLFALIFAAVLFAQTGHQVTLTWPVSVVDATNDAAVSYGVLRGTASGAESTTAIATVLASACTASACTFIDTTVAGGLTYFYEFTATNSGGISLPSPEVSFTVPAFPPNAPGKPTATGK